MTRPTRIALVVIIILAIAIFFVLVFPAAFGESGPWVAMGGGAVFIVLGVMAIFWGVTILTKSVFDLPPPGGMEESGESAARDRLSPESQSEGGTSESKGDTTQIAERTAGYLWLVVGGATTFFGAVAVFLSVLMWS